MRKINSSKMLFIIWPKIHALFLINLFHPKDFIQPNDSVKWKSQTFHCKFKLNNFLQVTDTEPASQMTVSYQSKIIWILNIIRSFLRGNRCCIITIVLHIQAYFIILPSHFFHFKAVKQSFLMNNILNEIPVKPTNLYY